jgi:hypothetical protein
MPCSQIAGQATDDEHRTYVDFGILHLGKSLSYRHVMLS